MNNEFRTGFLTSSQASRVITTAPMKTYVKEVHAERVINRPITTEIKTQPVKWGSLMEIMLFNKLSTKWSISHKETLTHKKYGSFWSGTPDFICEDAIAEAKCFQPKNFALLSLCLLKKDINLLKKEFPKEYWQCVSNCSITGKNKAVLITYMPYKDDLISIIKQYCEDFDKMDSIGLLQSDYFFMEESRIESLPYLPKDSKINDINSFEFIVPEEDFKLLESRFILANEMLKEMESNNPL
tara:strand:+ start:732 stop:1454 length:723 start_codon:yes stop_codon:yes gene_type:complete